MSKINSFHTKSQSGATAVEFSLIAGLLFIIILSLIEGGRYMTALGVLNAAADKAAAVAASEPDTRFAANQNTPEGKQDFQQAVTALTQKLQTKISEFLQGTFIGADADSGRDIYLESIVKVTVPTPKSSSESPEQALENVPITVEMQAQMIPLFPCFGALFNQKSDGISCNKPIPIKVFAASFKEPTKALTLPSPVDCQGRPFGSPGYGTSCNCDPDRYWDNATSSCICYVGDLDGDGDCDCPANFSFSTASKSCVCSLNSSSCTGVGQLFDAAACGCKCDSSKGLAMGTNGQCDNCTNSNYVAVNGICSCPQSAVDFCQSQGRVVDSDCSCICPAGQTDDGAGGCSKCVDPRRKFENGNCNSCADNLDCNGSTLNTTTCACLCDTWDSIYCNYYGGSWDATNCKCTCPKGGIWTDYSWGGGFCACPDPRQTMQYNYLTGKVECLCPDWQGLKDDGTGSCDCKVEAQDYDTAVGKCTCPPAPPSCPDVDGKPQVYDDVACKCACDGS